MKRADGRTILAQYICYFNGGENCAKVGSVHYPIGLDATDSSDSTRPLTDIQTNARAGRQTVRSRSVYAVRTSVVVDDDVESADAPANQSSIEILWQ